VRPRPRVLGTIASNEEEPSAKWAACDLAKVLVRPEELAHDAPAQRISLPADEADVSVPPSLAFGLRAREQRMLFEHLPLLSADMRTRREMTMVGTWQRWGDADAAAGVGVGDGQKKDAEGEPGKPNDTGRTEVQGTLLCSTLFFNPL
jgi:small subunit ribosomal protein S15